MKISVIIPAYNASPWIEQAVASAWEQTQQPDEVIVASDGSTDDTVQRAKGAGAKVLDLPKGNANVARNAGVRESTGELLFFLDADDWFKPDKIEHHAELQSTGRWSMVMDPATTVDEEGTPGRLAGPPLNRPVTYDRFTSRRFWFGGSSFSVAKSKLAAINDWREELRSQQDVDVWIRLAHRHGPAFILGTSHTWYRLTSGSTSRSPKNVLANTDILLKGLPFLSFAERRKLKSHIVFTAADNLPLAKALPLLSHVLDRAFDPRFAQALLRSYRSGRVNSDQGT